MVTYNAGTLIITILKLIHSGKIKDKSFMLALCSPLPV